MIQRGWWMVLAGCLVAGGIAVAEDPVLIEDMAAPAAVDGGSFDSLDGSPRSVLVDDVYVGEANAGPGMPECAGGGTPDQSIPPGWLPQFIGPAGMEHADTMGDADGGYCCPQGGGCRPASLWAIQVDALVLWRDAMAGQPLLSGTDGRIALDAGDVRTAAAAGPRIGVIRSLGCGRAVEGSYFNVGGIQGTTVTNGIAAPYTPIRLADIAFTDIDEAAYTTRGQIKSAELNYRWCQGRRVIWLAGFRWVEWNELATVAMQPSGDDISTQVGNDLYGGQFGCRLRLWNLGKWQVGAVGKAGGFANTAFQRTTATVDGGGFGPIGASDDGGVAFFGEVGVNSTLWLTHWLAWRAGYNFFWLEGVATAAQQYPLGNFGASTATIDTNGSVFLQGFSTGLEARW